MFIIATVVLIINVTIDFFVVIVFVNVILMLSYFTVNIVDK